jgi:hypothetical protein
MHGTLIITEEEERFNVDRKLIEAKCGGGGGAKDTAPD